MVRTKTTPLKELASAFTISAAIRKYRPDIIHLITAKPIILGGLLARLFRVPTLSAVTGLGYVFVHTSFKMKILRGVVISGYRLALNHKRSHVLFQNNDDLELLKSKGILNRAQYSLIPGCGVDLSTFTTHLFT